MRENSGHITYVLDGGRWTAHQVADHYINRPDDSGRYTYRDGLFTFYWNVGPSDWTKARLEVTRSGDIRFHDVVDGHPDLQNLFDGFFREWTRVGVPPRRARHPGRLIGISPTSNTGRIVPIPCRPRTLTSPP